MSDHEREASQDKHIPSDDELSRAADAAMEVSEDEETAEEETQEEAVEEEETQEEAVEEESEEEADEEDELPEEPEDASSRSKLGRKVKKIEQMFGAKIDTILQKLEQLGGQEKAEKLDEEDELDPNDYIKASDIPKILKMEEEKKQKIRSAYETRYLSKVAELGINEDMDDALHDAVVEEMQKNFNVKHSDDPASDATINFHRAYISVLKKSGSKRENPLKGGKPKAAIGVGGATESKPAKPKKTVKLDGDAAELARDMGLSDEDVANILAKKEKPHLSFSR